MSTFKSVESLSNTFDLKMTMVTMQVNDNSGEAKFVSSIEEEKNRNNTATALNAFQMEYKSECSFGACVRAL